jgi:pyrroline-5-carboxylate reductase
VSSLAAHSIGFIGAGNMAEAMIRGLVRGGHVPAARIAASGPRRERLDELAKTYGIEVSTDNLAVVKHAGLLVLCVKPQILDKVLREIGEHLPDGTLVVSIAAGVDTATI